MKDRNPVAAALFKRYGRTTTVMKDRRAPRGGSRNEQADFLSELMDDEETATTGSLPEGT